MRKNKIAKNVKELLLDLIFMTAGSIIYAVGLNGFTAPNNIAPGGVSGIAIVLNYLFGTPVGTVILLINVPIIIWAIIEIGYKLVTKTMLAVVLNAACIDIVALFMPVYHGDPLIIMLIGGVCEGVGLSLVFMRGATTGGTDMAAMIVHEHWNFPTVPMVLFAIDTVVVIIAAMAFGLQAGLFALLSLFTSTKAMDAIIKGFNTAMQFLIISTNQAEIVRRIHGELERGCTRLEATGTYEGRKNGALLCVVSRMEAAKLKKIVSEVDPHAFVTVCDVHEALGEGFTYQHTEK